MKLTMDKVGRIVVPKSIRERLGMLDGGTFDVSIYGEGVQLIPHGRTARLVTEDGKLVFSSRTVVTDDDVFGLIDSLRK
ncbi:MAG: AbrB/MazE/SpoVT family DNA-binding domain-containing protein [Salinibacterium sp.]|nr:MAG: AbrB/MazE/SpoVT family DNA-binding domain-containing protein [Salinibacterium sp.]